MCRIFTYKYISTEAYGLYDKCRRRNDRKRWDQRSARGSIPCDDRACHHRRDGLDIRKELFFVRAGALGDWASLSVFPAERRIPPSGRISASCLFFHRQRPETAYVLKNGGIFEHTHNIFYRMTAIRRITAFCCFCSGAWLFLRRNGPTRPPCCTISWPRSDPSRRRCLRRNTSPI